MRQVLVLGSGKIGRMIATFLTRSGDYHVRVGDVDAASLQRLGANLPDVDTCVVDARDSAALQRAMQGCSCVVSALSFHHNAAVAEAARQAGLSYFDLTEDIATTRAVRKTADAAAAGQVFMPQCGLAPGFVSIVAHHLTQSFDELDTVFMRVGALPQFPSNVLKYNLTWSTDGLINEYCNRCEAIHEGARIDVLPLEGLEHLLIDGVRYEAFNTSGGLGTLCETLEGKVRELNYRTIRYVGHRDLIHFLVEELRLSQRRELLKDVLEHAIPVTWQDVVVIFCAVAGRRRGQLVQVSDARKIYHQTIHGQLWSAIQITTAASVCAVVDLHYEGRLPKRGFVRQEDVDFHAFIDNRFGRHFRGDSSTRVSSDSLSMPGDDDGP